MIEILDGNQAAAYAVKLVRVKCFPAFPITPQTEIMETIAEWKADGKINIDFWELDSEHSVLSAALGSEATGARTFTATSSQGLLLMHEILYNVSGLRLPMVMVNVARGLSAPLTLWSDMNDFFAMRDTGWISFICETNQEVLDTIIMAYKIAESEKILLPVLVNMDGFIHSYTRTQVDVPNQKKIDKFLPKLDLDVTLNVKKPKTLGMVVMKEYMFFRSQVHKALLDSKDVIKKVHDQWYKLTKRKYDVVEKYKLNNAKVAVVIAGANSTIAKAAVDSLRKRGIKVGLLRIRLYRPFPEQEIKSALRNIKKVAVLDQNICPGLSGILYPEVKSALFGEKVSVSNYIIGLGGKPVSQKEFENIFRELLRGKEEKRKWLL
jgi:pyruvate ferredoxin oxidoreductase alpha subunit